MAGWKLQVQYHWHAMPTCSAHAHRAFDLATHTWSQLQASGELPGRRMSASLAARGQIIVLSGGLITDTTSSLWQQLSDAYLLDLSSATLLWRQFKGQDSGKSVARTSTRPFTAISEVAILGQPSQVVVYNQVRASGGGEQRAPTLCTLMPTGCCGWLPYNGHAVARSPPSACVHSTT